MNFLELTAKRQSDRAYLSKDVTEEQLDYILQAARWAPSACNAQPWKIIVVDNPETRSKIADATSEKLVAMNQFTKQAPLHLVVVEENANFTSNFGGWVKKKHFPLIDIGILAEHICLAAADIGLGSCMIGWFDETKIRKLLAVPTSKRIVLVITIGHPAKETRAKVRKPIEKIVSHNRY